MSEIQRLKKKVNKLIKERNAAREEHERYVQEHIDLDVDILREVVYLLREEHDQVHHAGGCKSCKALSELENLVPMDDDNTAMNHEGWRKVNGIAPR